MKPKLKPNIDLETVQDELIETVCSNYKKGVSVRTLAKQFDLSPMKTRKILITGGCYTTDLSSEIDALYKDGKTVGQIAEILSTTPANVNSYLPYERIIYNMEERSVEADRQARYRERLRSGARKKEKELPKIERERLETMVIVVGKKLRKLLPEGVFDASSDPLARDKSYTWGSNEEGEFVLHEPEDPDRMIWCAELTTSGRGKGKKMGIVLESANCGFVVISGFPIPPVLTALTPEERDSMNGMERQETEGKNRELIAAYRKELEKTMLESIRSGMLAFCLPEDRVLDYTETVARVELVKGRASTPAFRLEEFIESCPKWDAGDEPAAQYNIKSNWTSRKFGNSDSCRSVDEHTCAMLRMYEEECRKWLSAFLEPISTKLKANQ